ncbi:MAG TPA: hypothetical protein VGE24_14085 [Emticicia sp.]
MQKGKTIKGSRSCGVYRSIRHKKDIRKGRRYGDYLFDKALFSILY